MDKIKLTNDTILNIDNISINDTTMVITFSGIELNVLRNNLTQANLSTIEVLTETDVVCAIYNGYKKVDSYLIVPGNEDTITVKLIKQNEIEERLECVEDAVKRLILSELGVI